MISVNQTCASLNVMQPIFFKLSSVSYATSLPSSSQGSKMACKVLQKENDKAKPPSSKYEQYRNFVPLASIMLHFFFFQMCLQFHTHVSTTWAGNRPKNNCTGAG